MPKMSRKELLSQYYRELREINTRRKSGEDCWDEYYIVLKRIKHLLRYGDGEK